MNKKILFIIIFLCIGFSIKAQDKAVPFANNKFAVKAGYNYSFLNSASAPSSSGFIPGFFVGIARQFKLTKHTSFQPILSFSNQGGSFGIFNEAALGFDKGKIHQNYISIPLLFKFYTGKTFNFQVAPYFAYLLSTKQVITSGSTNDIQPVSPSYTNNSILYNTTVSDFRRLDYGLSLGMGYDFNFGLTIAARTTLGFTHPYKNPNLNGGLSFGHALFQLEAGYCLGNISKFFKGKKS